MVHADTEYTIEEQGVKRTIPLKANQILLDLSFIQPGQVHALCGKRRFTLAHECAHQILFGMESDNDKRTHESKYAPRAAYSLRDLKTREDWNEWQANVLGAAILMPQKEIDIAMRQFARGRVLKNYEGRFNYKTIIRPPNENGIATYTFLRKNAWLKKSNTIANQMSRP